MKISHAVPLALQLEVIALFLGFIASLSCVCPWAALDLDALSSKAIRYQDRNLSEQCPAHLPSPAEANVYEKGGVTMEPYNLFLLVVILTTWLR